MEAEKKEKEDLQMAEYMAAFDFLQAYCPFQKLSNSSDTVSVDAAIRAMIDYRKLNPLITPHEPTE